ncbi:MAG TPA: pyruvate, phosphate dikinase [Streptosporangiaceae bacterium]|jgi:pyruvate,orthophosphate dikinase|nr:pyruvate, phosphate dikinase [Streptosporangiaceae bacterium]
MVNDDAGQNQPPALGRDAGIFAFDHQHAGPAQELVQLLGGKGAGLAEMSAALGLAVPPGFTVSVPVGRVYRSDGWPAGLDDALTEHTERLGQTVGRRFGDAADPLLLAVRSGAPVSMPGMLDTVLNLGLNDETVLGLAARSGDERFAWDSYRRFVLMYATTVMGVPEAELAAAADGPAELSGQVARLRERAERIARRPLPADPYVQLREAVEAVFRSWECGRARAYRAKEGIDEDMGTAVNVQAMVFGNRGPRSGTGVVFTRDPATGEPVPYGDYLPQAQGEDVVAGAARTMPISHLGEHEPAAYQELLRVLRRLEVHYRDVCDVEFTIEDGRLWLLQTRIGKRSAGAAVRIAVDLVDDPDIRLDPAEALIRVPVPLRERARREAQGQAGSADAGAELFVIGLGASPGRVSGRVVLSSEEAADADGDVILVRAETSPEDVAGMAASAGVLTTTGGLVSHAAVVARGWGIPAVVGAHELALADGQVCSASGLTVRAGEVITIDGTTGQVWRGTVSSGDAALATEAALPQLDVLEAWAQTLIRL